MTKRAPAAATTRTRLQFYLYLAPTFALLAFIYVIPAFDALGLSFQRAQGLSPATEFIGLDNYRRVFTDPTFWQVAQQTLVWTLGVVTGTVILAFGLALVLNSQFRGKAVFRIFALAPAAASIALLATVWRLAFEPNGYINYSLAGFSHELDARPWLADTPDAMTAVIIVGVMVSIPFSSLMLAAAMRSISPSIYEVAALDGASPLRMAVSITLPLIRTTLAIVTMANFIGAFNSFSIIFVMTGGGPVNRTDNIATYLYDRAFTFLDFGGSAAITVIALATLAVMSLFYVHLVIHRRLE